MVAVFLFVGLVLGALLFFFNPASTKIYPSCAFHEVTGLYCPGCGSTRALYYLLHGELREALRYNALFVLVLPLLGTIFFACAIRRRPSTTTPRWQWHWLAVLVTLIVVFGVIRNIRLLPFSLLAPPAESLGK